MTPTPDDLDWAAYEAELGEPAAVCGDTIEWRGAVYTCTFPPDLSQGHSPLDHCHMPTLTFWTMGGRECRIWSGA